MSLKILSRTTAWQGSHLSVEVKQVRGNTGEETSWECIHRNSGKKDAVAVLGLTGSGLVPLILNWRVPTEGYILELPAGLIDKDKSLEEIAVDELNEEAGCIPTGRTTITELITVFSSPGMTDEKTTYFFADNLKIADQAHPEEFEDINRMFVPLEDLTSMVYNPPVSCQGADGKILTALGIARHLKLVPR